MLIWTDRLLFPCDEFYSWISLPSSQEMFLLCSQIRTMLAGSCGFFLKPFISIFHIYSVDNPVGLCQVFFPVRTDIVLLSCP